MEEKHVYPDWSDGIPDTEPEDGCQLFEQYKPDGFEKHQPGPKPGPEPDSEQPTQTAKKLGKDVWKMVAIVLFAFSQCSATEPPDKTTCVKDAKAKAAEMCLDMNGCAGGLQKAIKDDLLKACLVTPGVE